MKRKKFPFLSFVLIVGLFGFSELTHVRTAKAVEGSSLAGKVIFEGTPPAPQIIKADADPTCLLQHQDGIASEEIVANPNGTLKNVLVFVKGGLEGQTFEAPKEPVVFDQSGCHYTPHVFGIQVNQPLQILNSDDTLHNVHALPQKSKEFNLGMPLKGMKLTKTFTSPEVGIKIKCEVHPWMSAYAGVFDHPFYSVTGDDGTFTLKDLPPGEYVLEAWQEKLGSQTQTVKVPEAAEVTFSFKVD